MYTSTYINYYTYNEPNVCCRPYRRSAVILEILQKTFTIVVYGMLCVYSCRNVDILTYTSICIGLKINECLSAMENTGILLCTDA